VRMPVIEKEVFVICKNGRKLYNEYLNCKKRNDETDDEYNHSTDMLWFEYIRHTHACPDCGWREEE